MFMSFLNGILVKSSAGYIRYLHNKRLAQYDFFKDPIYFRITPLSVYITNIIILSVVFSLYVR